MAVGRKCPGCGELLDDSLSGPLEFCEGCGGGSVTLGDLLGFQGFEETVINNDRANGSYFHDLDGEFDE